MLTRRKALQLFGLTTAAALVNKSEGAAKEANTVPPGAYTLCLNMATIRGHKLGFIKELETAASAGYRSVEIWIDSLQDYLNNSGSISIAKRKLDDLGLKVEDCISFHEWIVDDNIIRQKAVEQMKRDMDMLAQLGCKRIAATGKGATATDVPNLNVIAQRYRTILDLGETYGVVPQIEMWGFQQNLQCVAEVLYIAMKSRNPAARVLLDVFHLYRGNTSLDTLQLMDPNAVEMFHMNDYPAGLPYQTITDADRIYPGDGIAPLKSTLGTLLRNRTTPLILSVELFNPAYYRQDALLVAKTSLNKMKAVIETL